MPYTHKVVPPWHRVAEDYEGVPNVIYLKPEDCPVCALAAEREAREKAERERDEAQRKLAEVQHDFAKVTPEVIAAQRRLDEARLAFQHQLAERDVQIAAANEMILDLVNQSCRQPDGTLDSQALSTYAEAIEYLERIGKVEVTTSYGRRVIATLKGGKP